MCTCEEIEKGTHAYKAGARRMIVDSGWYSENHNPRTPPRVRKTNTFIVFYLLVLHSVTCQKTCHFTACLTSLCTSISVFYVNTARDVVTVCVYLLNIYHFTYTFSYSHTDTHIQAQIYNQHTRGMATTRHRSLVDRGGRKAFVKDKAGQRPCTHTKRKIKMSGKTRYSRI